MHAHTRTCTHTLSQFPGKALLLKYTTIKHREGCKSFLLVFLLLHSLPSCSSENSDPNQFCSFPAASSQEHSQPLVLLKQTAHKSATKTNSTSNQAIPTLIVPLLSINLSLTSPIFMCILFINY